jgi:hypothetical protein
VGKHSVVYKLPLAMVHAPRTDIADNIATVKETKDAFFAEDKKDSLISKDAAEILRGIDEECAKEQDELNEQLKANI